MVFSADDGTHGREPWMHQPGSNPALVDDVYSGADSSQPGEFLWLNDTVYFLANRGGTNPIAGHELWRIESDGTTTLVQPLPKEGGLVSLRHPRELVSLNGQLFFLADGGLHTSDGSESGTVLVKNLTEGQHLRASAMHLFLEAESALWRSDGTNVGTTALNFPFQGGLGYVDALTPLGTLLLFRRHGTEFWQTDFTEPGTINLVSAANGTSRGPQFASPLPSDILFVRTHLDHGTELWVTDGSAQSTELLKDIAEGSASSSPDHLLRVRDRLFFVADDGVRGREPCISDGTPEGTMCIDLVPGPGGSQPHSLVLAPFDEGVILVAMEPDRGAELVWIDLTGERRQVLPELVAGPGSASPLEPTRMGLYVYVVANDGETGAELWAIDLTSPALLALLGGCLNGPKNASSARVPPSVELCLDAFDASADGVVDLADAAALSNRAFIP